MNFWGISDGVPVSCSVCGGSHTHGVDAISYGDGSGICAWCHFGEFGVWPHGMTQEYEYEQEAEGLESL